MPVLICRKTEFYSDLDEEAFFTVLKKIKAVKGVEGRSGDLFVSVSTRVSHQSLRQLVGLFFRYKIEMRQLAQFATPANRVWFRRKESYWFKKVFG